MRPPLLEEHWPDNFMKAVDSVIVILDSIVDFYLFIKKHAVVHLKKTLIKSSHVSFGQKCAKNIDSILHFPTYL